jgi:cytochrome c6
MLSMNIQLSGFLFLLALLPQVASAAPPALPGQAIFQKNCVRCHGANGKRGLNGAHDLTKSNLNEFGRSYLVTNGMGKMPAFGKTLTPEQVQQVVTYSLTLK